jgi:hypothetical protein
MPPTFEVRELPKTAKEEHNVRNPVAMRLVFQAANMARHSSAPPSLALTSIISQVCFLRFLRINALPLSSLAETRKDDDVQHLKEAVWTHKVVVVKGQKDLEPIKQWELVTRFDPDAEQVHSHGDVKTFAAKGGMLSKSRDVFGIPGAENVRLIGKGFQGEDHYGIKNTTIKGLSNDWHAKPLSDEDFQAGHTRFQRWHMDAPLYDREPALFTTLRCIKQPQGPDVTIGWDDDSGYSMKSKPGLTGFFSNSQLYNIMTEDEQRIADNSW